MTIATQQVPGVQRRKLGEVLVTAVNDGYLMLPAEVLQGIDPAERERLYRAGGRRPPFASALNTFLLQWQGRNVLVDTGGGRAVGPTAGRLTANLQTAGVSPGEIDAVLLTHLHIDHVSGLLDEAGAPAFPRAELMVADAELAFWQDDAKRDAAPKEYRGTFDAARGALAPYGERVHRFTGPIVLPGITAVPLPGHTPGHTGYQVEGGGETLVIWGDVCHAPEVQAARPDLTLVFDTDPAMAAASRRSILARAAAEDLLITGMHMNFPGFCRIAKAGEGYVIQPEAWQYELA